MSARIGIERGNANEAMHADFGLEVAVRIRSLDSNRGTFDSGAFARLQVEDFCFETPTFRPPQIHAEQHFCPVLSFEAAGTGVNSQDGVSAIVFTGKQAFELESLELFAEFRDKAFELTHGFGVALASEFHQNAGVVEFARQLAVNIEQP